MTICDDEGFVKCDTPMSWEQLARLLIGVSTEGCPAVRTVVTAAAPLDLGAFDNSFGDSMDN